MPFTFRASLVLCLAVGSVPAMAAQVVDWLYDVEVQVASQADAERSRAARQALEEVLARVTGMAEPRQVPEVEEALRRPERFYARYEYSRRLPVAQEGAVAEPATFLQLHFEAAAVLAMLRSADLPVWVANRPTILAWVAMQRQGRRTLLSATGLFDAKYKKLDKPGLKLDKPGLKLKPNMRIGGSGLVTKDWGRPASAAITVDGLHHLPGQQPSANGAMPLAVSDELAAELQRRARWRGLKLLLPLLDLQDSSLAAEAVWGLFWEDIQGASARYAPDLLLVGRAVEDKKGNWTADWQLRMYANRSRGKFYDGSAALAPQGQLDGFAKSFKHHTKSAKKLALLGLDGTADALADRFSVRGALGSIPVLVRGAQTVRGYASLLAHLQSREFIERVDVDAVQPKTLGLRLHSRSNREQLRKLLAMGDQLVVESNPDQPLAVSWRGPR